MPWPEHPSMGDHSHDLRSLARFPGLGLAGIFRGPQNCQPMGLLPLRRLPLSILPLIGGGAWAAESGNDLRRGEFGEVILEACFHGGDRSGMPGVCNAQIG